MLNPEAEALRLNFLLIEDNEDDAILIISELKRNGILPHWKRVVSAAELSSAIEDTKWDVIISDYHLPDFTIFDAHELYKSCQLDIPFIVVSGVLDEKVGASLMRIGAHDIVLKHDLSRLAPAILRELNETKIRAERSQLLKNWQRFLDLSLEVFGMTNTAGQIIFLNDEFQHLLGHKHVDSQVIGKTWVSLLFSEDRPAAQAMLKQLQKGLPIKNFDCRVVHEDGSLRWWSWSASSDLGENLIYFVAQDITASKVMERRVKQIQKMEALGTLTAGLTHDMRSCLIPIRTIAKAALKDLSSSSKMHHELELILHSATQAADMLTNTLDFSTLQVSGALAPLMIDHVIQKHLPLLRSAFPLITFSLEIDPACQPVQGNNVAIEQIIINLIKNSVDAMDEEGVIHIKVTMIDVDQSNIQGFSFLSKGRYVCQEIVDHGKGIPQDQIEKVCDPFFTTKPEGKGTGLGLWMVHSMVKELGGEIVIESILGKGTTVTIFYPII